MNYSQNSEQQIISRYFGDFKGTLLDLGCNNGVTFSNSRQLILDGWSATLVDASPRMAKECIKLYQGNDKVDVLNFAIYTEDGMGVLHESGAHVPNGSDYSLVSTIMPNEMNRWQGVEFKEVDVPFICFDTMLVHLNHPKYDFISLDVEGVEFQILQQINLTSVGCKCLCIEWNSRRDLERLFTAYCGKHGMKEIHRNAENIIFAI